jgi:hypothetical protein
MDHFRALNTKDATPVGWGVSVMFASMAGEASAIAQILRALGGHLEVESRIYDALSFLSDDPRMADILVVDCDAYGGLAAGRRAFAMLMEITERLPVILISRDVAVPRFPIGREAGIELTAPASFQALDAAFARVFSQRRIFRA